MTFKPMQAVLADAAESFYLRLETPIGAFVWYKPTDDGFVIVSDEKADELETAYQGSLQ